MTHFSPADLKRNQNLLLGYFIYTTFHGALRKWVFMGNSGMDNLLFSIQLILPFLVIWKMKRQKPILSYQPLLPYALLLIGMALNPMNQTLYHGLFGFILHFGFWLVLLAYINERDSFPMEKLVTPFIIIVLIETGLSFLQFSLPATHFLNRYVSSDNVDGFGDGLGVRVIGTFSYIAGYGSFLYFLGLFVWALMVENKRGIFFVLFIAALGLISGFMNGSRGVVLPFAISITIGFLSYGSLGTRFKSIAMVGLVIGLSLIFGVDKKLSSIERAFTAFNGRVKGGQESGEAKYRANKSVFVVLDFNLDHALFGVGLGSTYQGANTKWGVSRYLGFYEEEPERVILEGGYLLLITRLFLFAFLITRLKIPAVYSIPVLFYLFFFTQLIFNTYQAAFTFFGLAIIDKMYYLKQDYYFKQRQKT